VILTAAAVFLDLPLLARAATPEEIHIKNVSTGAALVLWTVSVGCWIAWFRLVYGAPVGAALTGGEKLWEWTHRIGCLVLAGMFLGFIALITLSAWTAGQLGY